MLSKFIPIWLAYFFAAVSPGPGQVYVVEEALSSPRLGRWGALGVTAGSALWVILVSFGLSHFVNAFPSARFVLRIGSGSLLLFFIATNVINLFSRARGRIVQKKRREKSAFATFIKGLLVNLLNPQSVVVFLSLLAPLMLSTSDSVALLVCSAGVSLISLVWYQCLARLAAWSYFRTWLVKIDVPTRIGFIALYFFFLIKLVRNA